MLLMSLQPRQKPQPASFASLARQVRRDSDCNTITHYRPTPERNNKCKKCFAGMISSSVTFPISMFSPFVSAANRSLYRWVNSSRKQHRALRGRMPDKIRLRNHNGCTNTRRQGSIDDRGIRDFSLENSTEMQPSFLVC